MTIVCPDILVWITSILSGVTFAESVLSNINNIILQKKS